MFKKWTLYSSVLKSLHYHKENTVINRILYDVNREQTRVSPIRK